MNESEAIEALREEVRRIGSQKAFAEAHGISEQYVSDMLRGRRAISDRVLGSLGLERVTTIEYRRRDESSEP